MQGGTVMDEQGVAAVTDVTVDFGSWLTHDCTRRAYPLRHVIVSR